MALSHIAACGHHHDLLYDFVKMSTNALDEERIVVVLIL
jgi:hypothetical protein